MPSSLRPYRDESLHDAARRIRRFLEQEERAKSYRASPRPSNGPIFSGGPQHRQDGFRPPSVSAFPPSLLDLATAYEPLQEGIGFGDDGSSTQLAQAVPMPGPVPLPVPLPPIVIPGSKENEEWVRRMRKLLRELGRSLPGGGPNCDEEWNDARRTCREELGKSNPNESITGGYSNVEDCARGLVSEHCGGNKVRWPRSWKSPRRRK